MTRTENQADYPNYLKCVERGGQRAEQPETDRPSPERTQAANEVGSAIAHQLNGPLTALRLYICETAEAQDMQQMVEAAFQETERLCSMMRLITDTFEEPLYPETAAALGRDVISWWSRSGSAESGGSANGGGPAGAASSPSIHSRLTPREREVLSHVSQGCSNRQGAIRMQIGPRTFESHRARVMRKLGAKNAADLVRMALGERPVTP